MFVKSDGGESDSIRTARGFLSYDDAAAFCRAHKLAKVELVVHPDDQPEYVVAMPAKHLNDPMSSDVEDNGSAEEFGSDRWMIMPDVEAEVIVPCSCQRSNGVASEVNVEADGSCSSARCGEVEVDGGEAEAIILAWEIAIAMYAVVGEVHAPEFHFHPPEKCDVCGGGLSGRSFFVDGRVADGDWRDMCSQCFFLKGGRIGPGKGQLYQRQTDGRWLLVAGFGQ